MNNVGRPTDYRPEFGEELIRLMATGLSLSAAAASLGLHRQRFYTWAEKYPELADNINVARGKRLLHLEQRLLSDETPGPAMTGTIFALKNADAEEWREKVVNETTGPNGGPQEHNHTHSYSPEAKALVDEVLAGLK